MRRGTFVTVSPPGEYCEPRPALIVQSSFFEDLPSVVLCPLTTMLRSDAGLFRLDVEPVPENGLRERSQIAIDKITDVPGSKLGRVTGKADDVPLLQVNRALALFLGLG